MRQRFTINRESTVFWSLWGHLLLEALQKLSIRR